MNGSISRITPIVDVEASPAGGVTINGVNITWKEWTDISEWVEKQWKRLIQIHHGRIIPGDTINGKLSTAADWDREINCIEEVVREEIPGYYQVTSGIIKPGDRWWWNSGWEDVPVSYHGREVRGFAAILRRI